MTGTNIATKSYILDDFPHDLPAPPPKLAKNIFDNFSLKGKVAIISGGATGIGYAVAESYAQAGADIAFIFSKNPKAHETAQELASQYKNNVKAYKCDVSDCESVEATIAQIESDFGTVDVFVANAGMVWEDGAILDPEHYAEGPEKWTRLMDVNLNSVYYCARAVGKIFKSKGSGSFIITASMSGHIANVPNIQACYNASKAGCLHLGRSLAVEWAGFARVNTVSPGYVNTPISDFAPRATRAKWWSLIPMGREALPQELAGAYLYLASDASTYTTGSDIKIDGGYCSV